MAARFHHIRSIVYFAALASGAGVIAVSVGDDLATTLVQARELLGLWALALLLSSMMLGPLVALFPRLPLRAHLLYARRAVGVSACAFAVAHVICYLASPLRRGWRELYTPGIMWVVGLLLGFLALSIMVALAITSRDAAVKRMGGRRWKRLHRLIYPLLGLVLIHAVLVGADFGLSRGPDVTASPDAGALIGFSIFAALWGILFALRWRRRKEKARPVRSGISV
jgi:methionine sulfoxide reductase heme-binding subunit